MNSAAKAYWMGIEQSSAFIDCFTAGMEGEDWLQKPAGVTNPAIWILGHLAHSRARFLYLLTGQKVLEPGWEEVFGMGIEPQDPGNYPDLEACHTVLDARLQDLKKYLESATEQDLEGPPCAPSEYFKTKSAVLVLLTHHEAHHTGALSMIRRALGKDRVI